MCIWPYPAICLASNPVLRPPEGGRIPRRVYFQMSYFQESRGSSVTTWDGYRWTQNLCYTIMLFFVGLLGVGCWLIVFVVVVVVLHCWMCLFTPSNEGPQWVCCSIFQTKFKIIFLQIPSWIEHVCRCTLGLFIFIKGHLLTFKSQWGTGCTQCVRWETPQPRRHKDHYTWSNYSWWREIPSFEKTSGWWNIVIWPWHNFCRGSPLTLRLHPPLFYWVWEHLILYTYHS